MPTPLRLAVCLFPAVAALDFQGPLELLGFLSPQFLEKGGAFPTKPSYSIEAEFLSITMDPVAPMSGPYLVPTGSYSTTEKQYDIILVPGGLGARPDAVPGEVLAFIKRQAPGLKYLLSVCTGSWILAEAGMLNGKRATTNKSGFKEQKEATAHLQITWVPKARWVVDDNFKLWTSSGLTAGQDMANAFLEHLVGKEHSEIIRNIVELSVKQSDDDEFAEHYGLLA